MRSRLSGHPRSRKAVLFEGTEIGDFWLVERRGDAARLCPPAREITRREMASLLFGDDFEALADPLVDSLRKEGGEIIGQKKSV